jgi:hypothetical protein
MKLDQFLKINPRFNFEIYSNRRNFKTIDELLLDLNKFYFSLEKKELEDYLLEKNILVDFFKQKQEKEIVNSESDTDQIKSQELNSVIQKSTKIKKTKMELFNNE